MSRPTTAARGRLITLTDAGERLSLDEQTIRRYIAAGKLTGYRIGPRVLRVDLDQVDALARPIPSAKAAS